MTKVIEGQLSANGIRFGIVAARFNEFVVGPLIEGALDTIARHGGSRQEVTIVRVPGSFEIPLACKKLAQTKTVDAIIAIGAVIRGSTTHYDYVCNQATGGIGAVGLECELPVTFGVITTDTIEQAIERSGCKAGNKGSDAALAAIEMVSVLRQLAK